MTQIEQEHTGLATLDTSTEAVEALLKDMTEGPWEAALERGCHGVIAHSLPAGGANFVALVGNDPESAEKEPSRFANARFIAASRELVPALLAERDALKAYVKAQHDYKQDLIRTCEKLVAAEAELDRLKAQADAVWNDAIEAAAGHCFDKAAKRLILSLKRPVKGESHE